jgi:asparagine synthetase B (glutamine-hydrolysing)
MFLMSRKIKALGVKMVLSGEGSDEVFGGYLYFHKAPNKVRRWRSWLQRCRRRPCLAKALPGEGPAWRRPCLAKALHGEGPAWRRPCLAKALPDEGLASLWHFLKWHSGRA